MEQYMMWSTALTRMDALVERSMLLEGVFEVLGVWSLLDIEVT